MSGRVNSLVTVTCLLILACQPLQSSTDFIDTAVGDDVRSMEHVMSHLSGDDGVDTKRRVVDLVNSVVDKEHRQSANQRLPLNHTLAGRRRRRDAQPPIREGDVVSFRYIVQGSTPTRSVDCCDSHTCDHFIVSAIDRNHDGVIRVGQRVGFRERRNGSWLSRHQLPYGFQCDSCSGRSASSMMNGDCSWEAWRIQIDGKQSGEPVKCGDTIRLFNINLDRPVRVLQPSLFNNNDVGDAVLTILRRQRATG